MVFKLRWIESIVDCWSSSGSKFFNLVLGSLPSLLESWLGLEQSCCLAWEGRLRLASWPVMSCTYSGSSTGEASPVIPGPWIRDPSSGAGAVRHQQPGVVGKSVQGGVSRASSLV
jgi:hypothetical protein